MAAIRALPRPQVAREARSRVLMGLVRDVLVGSWSLITGMAVTIRRYGRRNVTVQYPRKRLEMSPAYRGHIELVRFEDSGRHNCVACGTCVRFCPTNVIKVQGEKEQARSKKRATLYFIDFSHCSLCGLCVANCPTKTLKFSNEYELAHVCRWEGVVDLIRRVEASA
jgi:NADH-quinone oxidoreductase subunit I